MRLIIFPELPSDFTIREVAGAGIGVSFSIIGVNIGVNQSVLHGGCQSGDIIDRSAYS
jgi:hypothetical protein